MKNKDNKLTTLHQLLSGVDDTYASLPLNLRLQIERVSQGLSELGPRKLGRRGPGTEFYESRDFRRGVDEPRAINARLSARAGKPIVVEREAEMRRVELDGRGDVVPGGLRQRGLPPRRCRSRRIPFCGAGRSRNRRRLCRLRPGRSNCWSASSRHPIRGRGG